MHVPIFGILEVGMSNNFSNLYLWIFKAGIFGNYLKCTIDFHINGPCTYFYFAILVLLFT